MKKYDMTAKKQYLYRLQRLDAIISQKKQEMSELEASITSISSPDPSNVSVKVSQNDPAFAKKVMRILDIMEEIRKDTASFLELRHHIICKIQKLQDMRQIQVLYKKYVEFKSLREVAAEMDYSYDHVKRLHSKALQNLEIDA